MKRGLGGQGGKRRVHLYLWIWIVLWSGTVAGLLAGDLGHIRKVTEDMVLSEARTQVNWGQATSRWASLRGGIYAEVGNATSPNPSLGHLPERDLESPSGKRLTLISPAAMLQELVANYSEPYGIYGQIKGLTNLVSETAPDRWERECLFAFAKGTKEVWELCDINGARYLRYMKPFYVEDHCLKCHTTQGYNIGEVGGGISVSVPMAGYLQSEAKEAFAHVASSLILWAVGILVIGFTARALIRRTTERDEAEARLVLSEKKYSKVVESSLTGMYLVQDGKVVYANPRFAEIHGYTVDELVGMDALSLVHPRDREKVAEITDKRFRGESVSKEYEARGLHKTGQSIWIKRRNTLTEYQGRPAILGNEEDVTEQKMAEKELRAKEEELRAVSTRLLHSWEEERKRIAHEVQDGLAQTMSAIKYRVESALACMREKETSETADLLKPVVAIVQEGVCDIRRMASRLRPMMLDDVGILPTIGWLCKEVQRTHPCFRVGTRLEIEEGQIPEPLKVVIYRILENGLDLLAKDGEDGSVEISLHREKGAIDLIFQTEEDVQARPKPSYGKEPQDAPGLSTMKELAILSGGSFNVDTGKEGSVLHVSWPQHARA